MAPDLSPPQPSLTFHGSEGIVSCLHSEAEGSFAGRLFSGSTHTFVYVWDLISTKKLLTKFQCDDLAEKNDTVLSIILSGINPDEVCVQVRNGSLHKWNLRESTPVRLYQTSVDQQLGFCPAVAFPEAELIALPSGDVAGNSRGIDMVNSKTFEPVEFLCPKENVGPPMRAVKYKVQYTLFVKFCF